MTPSPAGAGAAATSVPTSPSALLTRTASCWMDLRVDGPATLALQVAVAAGPRLVSERLEVLVDGSPVPVRELATAVGGRLHVLDASAGSVRVEYAATVAGAPGDPGVAAPAPPGEEELLVATRPSRYADSDRLAAVAAAELTGLSGLELLDAAAAWVHERLAYVPGSSRPTDAASDVLLAGQGVCRDYAHVVAALVRALDVPARVAAVYAPGLDPMDFHAVAEGWVDGAWHVVDATRLAPRSSLVRIATGRDTSDTAFLTTSGPVTLLGQEVVAVVEGALPVDGGGPVQLA